jgi:hypothetical protein
MTPDEHAFFFFCKSGDDNAQKTDRIMDHLIWFLYDQVPMSLEMLDRCNDVVRQYLTGRREGRNRKRGEQQELEKFLYFEDAFPKLAVVSSYLFYSAFVTELRTYATLGEICKARLLFS